MSAARPAPLLGRLAVHLKMVDLEQLAALTHHQAQAGDKTCLGELMIRKGLITRLQLDKLLVAQKQVVARHESKKLAEAAVAASDPDPEVAQAPEGFEAAAQTADPMTASAAPGTSAARGMSVAPAGDADGQLAEILGSSVALGASDIHIHSAVPLRVRRHGSFQTSGDAPLAPEHAERLARAAMTTQQEALFDERGELDFAYTLPGVGRFRVNAYRQQRGVDIVFRAISAEPPTLEELGLPGDLARFTNFHQGMVLVTGPANCGKSSTLAALVRILNEERRDHLLTIEDPIEYLHTSKRCVVNQRSVGPHTTSFARALRAALREDPDVIVIGELRDFETVSLALTAAETGHLVLGTMHTNSAIRTINRLIGVFPADQQDQVRKMVSESLRAVVSQRLVPTRDGSGRVPALEVLVVNKPVGNLVRENKTFQITSQLQMGSKQGMCLLDASLARLVREGLVSREEAQRHAEDPLKIGG